MVSPLFRRSRHAMALLALLALQPGWVAAQAQAPAAPALPPPDSVRLEQLGLMQGFPPAADKRVDVSNGYRYPQLRWVVQHLREIQPTQNIRRGAAAPSALPEAPMALGGLRFDDDKGQPVTVDQWLDRTYTDAIVVLHKGRVVFERYQNQMQASSPHLLFSVTKSFTGLMAAQLAHEGRIDPQALVTKYVPELEGSAWGDMTVRQVMDMTGAVRFREDYTDPRTEIFGYSWASGMLPRPPGYAGPTNVYDFLKTLPKEGTHGEGFVYRTVHSEVLGWIVSRVTGRRWSDLMSENIWQKLGMQEDAYVMVDSTGTPLQGAGLNATARDLARVGEMPWKGLYSLVSAVGLGLKGVFNVQGNVFIQNGLNGGSIEHLSTKVRQFHSFLKSDIGNGLGLFYQFWVGGINAVHIGPDFQRAGGSGPQGLMQAELRGREVEMAQCRDPV